MAVESFGDPIPLGGPAGPPNNLSIGTVQTGAAGSQALATVTGVSPNQALNLVIPKGDQGVTGLVPWAPVVQWAPSLICVASAPATVVYVGGSAYVCTASHIAGTFATDLAAGKWAPIAPGGLQPWKTPPVAWAASTAYSAAAPADCVTYAGGCYVCSVTHTSGSTFDASKWVQISAPAPAASAAPPSAQARLVFNSTTQIALIPWNGNAIYAGGAIRTIPAAGVTLANTGLTAGTQYYIYAVWNGSALALSASTTAPSVSASTGQRILGSDETQVYVGIVYMDAGTPGTFADTLAKRWVCSWFNQVRRPVAGAVGGYTTTSTTESELSTAARASFLTHASQAVEATASGNGGSGSSSVGYGMFARISLDNDTAAPLGFGGQAAYGNCTIASSYAWAATDGLHFLTVRGYGQASGTTVTWTGAVVGSIMG